MLTTWRNPSGIGIPTCTNGTSAVTTTAHASGSNMTACTTTTTSNSVLPTPAPAALKTMNPSANATDT